MSRCDHCADRYSWDCEDGYTRIEDNIICPEFELDIHTLSSEQKVAIQKILMNDREGAENE